MKKQLAWCVVSALTGAALVEVWRLAPQVRSAEAQESRLAPGATRRGEPLGRPGPLPPHIAGAPGRPAEDHSLTPEEQVNVAVYEHVNRSVVNINTRTVRNGAFLFFDVEVPGEGAGSGS